MQTNEYNRHDHEELMIDIDDHHADVDAWEIEDFSDLIQAH